MLRLGLRDGQGRLVVGDKPFFPVGMYEVAIPEIRSVPRESFNVVADPYWAQGPQTTPSYLKAAGESGFFLVAGLPSEQVHAKDDRFIELDRRGQIANNAGGKLFISIHCNSTEQKPSSANGFEVYLLRPGRTEEAIRIAEF